MNTSLDVTRAWDLPTMRSPRAAVIALARSMRTIRQVPPPYDRMSRKIVTRRSPIHGNGVFAARKLGPGVELIEYQGRLMTHTQADRLYEGGVDTGHTFLFTLNERWLIDANVSGNAARWINHSCAPNCQALLVESAQPGSEFDRVYIETLREVKAGEELAYDYGIDLGVKPTAKLRKIWACRCGAPECTGTLIKSWPK
jgi:SET domain-containing protein